MRPAGTGVTDSRSPMISAIMSWSRRASAAATACASSTRARVQPVDLLETLEVQLAQAEGLRGQLRRAQAGPHQQHEHGEERAGAEPGTLSSARLHAAGEGMDRARHQLSHQVDYHVPQAR